MEILHNIKRLEQYRKDLRKRMTKSETLLWSRLRGKQNGFKFRRQHSIGSFIVDFYCSECNLVIELDGITHGDDSIYNRDKQKEKFLKEKRITILRFNDQEVIKNINETLESIWQVCDSIINKEKE
jgi:very-short-patch-repair endonuclease